MVIVSLVSGLGNQLFQYAVGRQISINKNVPLKFDLAFYKRHNLRSYKLDKFNIKAEVVTQVELDRFYKMFNSRDLISRIYAKIDWHAPRHKKLIFHETEWWVYEPELYNTSKNVNINGYWQHYKYFENLSPKIFSELTVKQSEYIGVDDLVSSIQGDASSVAIHIRRGDYVTDKEANDLMGVLPLTYYHSAVDYIKERVNKPNFYFFSDDLEWVKENFKIDLPCFYIDSGKDYLDLDLMSKCRHNIIANSSFSWWSAFLNKNPDKIVISPKRWVVPEEINNRIEIQMPSWIKL